MTPELLKTELAHAEQAELESDDQLRRLTALIDKAGEPDGETSPAHCAKLVGAALALNARLRERTESLRRQMRIANPSQEELALRAKIAAMMPK